MITTMGKIGGALALGMFLLGLSPKAGAETTDKDAGHQIEIAVQCEKRAADLQASIDEQLRLKAVNMSHWQLRKSSPPSRDIADADKKYDAAIAALRDTQSGWMELAHFHRLQAMEMTASLPSTGAAVD